MHFTRKILTFFSLIFLLGISLHADEEQNLDYEARFLGVSDEKTLELLKSASQLIKLKKHPLKTQASLRRRAELDIPNLIQALHSRAYYNGQATYEIDSSKIPIEVRFYIETGPVYPFASVEIFPDTLNIKPEQIGIAIGSPAYPAKILAAEGEALATLSKMGYPLSKIKEREVIADQKMKHVNVKLWIEPGEAAFFGETVISGNNQLKETFIRGKIDWKAGERYNPSKLESTMNALEASGVFNSISITHNTELDENGLLPMSIQISEAKQRSIGLGVGYSTQFGPGITGQWEHRNFNGMGEKLRVNANLLLDTQDAEVAYLIPDFIFRGQDLICATEIEHERDTDYEEYSFSLSAALERLLPWNMLGSFGGMYEFLANRKKTKEGGKEKETYHLARIPLKLRWTNADDVLEPTEGGAFLLKAIPTIRLVDEPFMYTITTLTGSIYKPLSKEKRLILAAKINLGSIFGSSKIAESDLFSAGSENTLRGYSYRTVSPLKCDGAPLGGRSMMIYTLEARWRSEGNWGGALFYDIGNVFEEPIPRINKKMLQSIGVGVRYYTPAGPLRLDIAFPLNRRSYYDQKAQKKKTIDSPFQIYFSIGQSF